MKSRSSFPGEVTNTVGIVLVNALYFQGRWTTPFTTNNTSDQPFNVSTTQQVSVPMMSSGMPIYTAYAQENDFQTLELGVADSQVAVDILLPSTVDGLPALVASLTTASLQSALADLKNQQVNVNLPKLKLSTSIELSSTLEVLGMPLAFESADFSGMLPGTQLLFVQHQGVLDLEEGGLSAAGATAVGGFGASAGGGPTPAYFNANHPFLILIRDRATSTVLFLGQVTNP